MEWLGENHIKGEMNDADFAAKVKLEAKTRDIKRHGRDGNFEVYREHFTYKKIPYDIAIQRYYVIGTPIDEVEGMSSLHFKKWAVLEHTKKSKPIADLMERLPYPIGYSEWLWGDTTHINNENQSLKQMVECLHNEAKVDIDNIGDLRTKFSKFVNETSQDINEIIKLAGAINPEFISG